MTRERRPVLILTGAPGSGKTTAARLLAERSHSSAHIESDWFFRFIVSGYADPWKPESHDQNTSVMRIVGDVAVAYARAGYATIVDGIVIPGWFLEPLRDAMVDSGLEVAYAVLRVPLQTALERAGGRSSPRAPDPEAIEQIWKAFGDLGPLERHAIDTGSLTPEETADAISGLLERGVLGVA